MRVPLGQPLVVRTLDAQIYEAIRDRIVHGLAPGTPLRLADLATQFRVSIMPVRAALARLESDGLVRQQPHRASVVSPLELEDFEEIQALRAGIEGYAARLGAQAIDQADVRKMKALLRRLATEAVAGDLDSYLAVTAAFHDVCYDATGRPRLSALVAGHRRAAERYVRAVLAQTPGFADSVASQERFLAACEARDGQAAEQELRTALDWMTAQVARLLGEQLETPVLSKVPDRRR
jgi:DNA-binding GntR family transcriptional regulator